ncbi:MAG: riboflavin biosynthesis protein RibF [Clostridia bacterium]|nr:riboflavin biosynthesis protein RibF [Clostridia bacterium]
MLNTVYLSERYQKNSPCVLLLGGFDGVHLGHSRLLSRAKEFSLPIGIMTIVGGKGDGVFTLEERREIFSKSGIDFCVQMEFAKIRNLTPEQFVSLLTEEFEIAAFVCGDDFLFGYKASGTPQTLKSITNKQVIVEKLFAVDGEKVSTSSIKKLLSQGQIERANFLLGDRFFLKGKVTEGRKIGRTLCFPTANIDYPIEKYPLKIGVYETRVQIGDTEYKGITNFGARPTFDDKYVCTETYIDRFQGDLYGKTLTVQFVRYLRGVEKFSSVDGLKEQLKKDIERVRND